MEKSPLYKKKFLDIRDSFLLYGLKKSGKYDTFFLKETYEKDR